MNQSFRKSILFILFSLIWIVTDSQALPLNNITYKNQPIIILALDKVESIDLFSCKLPAIREFIQKSACGVMSVRSGNGYNKTESGFLSFGTGNRSVAPPIQGGAFKPWEVLIPGKAGFIWRWVTGIEPKGLNLVVPEIGWVANQSESGDLTIYPGLLGEIFRSNGWQTVLIGDQDTIIAESRPGGYTVMDRNGIIDTGMIGAEINANDETFPYRHRFDPEKTFNGVSKLIKSRSLIFIEFGDFSRLDEFREEILPEQYERLKQEAWERLERFLAQLATNWTPDQYRLLMVSPSLSSEGIAKRSMLAPIVIRSAGYPKGLLTSGTTNWDGLVANIDLLPTLINMAGLIPNGSFSGRPIHALSDPNHLQKLAELNIKINTMNASQRSLLDWYLWIISTGWLAVTLSILLKKRLGNGFLLIIVVTLPLAMLIMPLLPVHIWQEGGMFIITAVLTMFLMKLKTTDQRYLVLTAALWGGLVLDQFTGWNLIRFSALGYSAVAGSRYYGIGNEYMGVLLAVTLILAHLISRLVKARWPVLAVLGFSVLILGWPQFGINFGGTMAALVGFSFYAVKLYHLDWNNRKVWTAIIGIILMMVLVGWWDSLREPDLQTHLGRFFQLLIDQNLSETWQIFSRKAEMNLKLLAFSAWAKTILLALGINIVIRMATKEKLISADERLIWNALLISGYAAFIINDSGVVSFGTCLAFGFSFFLSRFEERVFLSCSQEPGARSQLS